ncbi:unnamed protein product [Symbiodinium sp. CCMP2592]|nr:unnamed protein product [Symbiodinium sp. CCMP2592]
MANQVVWKCRPCGRTCGKTAEFCAQCGQHWSKVAEGYTGQGWRHGWRSEASDGQYPQSPRRRSPRKRPPKGPGPGQKGGKQQGQPQPAKGGKGGKSEPSRPSLDSLPAPPPAPVVVGPKTATTPAPASGVPSAERAQLEALTGCLFAAKDALPAEVRETLERLQLVETQSTAKDLHKAVAAQSQAKKQLLHVQASRASYLEAWHTYVDKVSSLLQTQLNEQIEQLTAFDETELQWTTALEKASMDLARLARSSSNPAEQLEMECDEEEDHLVETDIRTERELSQRREKQLHASRQLVASIESVRLNAQEQLQQHGREGSRTPRRRKADVDLTKEENLEDRREAGPADSGQDGGGSKDGKNGEGAEDFVDEWCASFSGAALAHEVSLFDLDLEVEHTFWTDPRHAAGQYDFEEAAWDTLPTQSCDYEALEVFFTESYADAHCQREGQTVLSGTVLTSRTFRVPTLHMAKQVVELDEVRGISQDALESDSLIKRVYTAERIVCTGRRPQVLPAVHRYRHCMPLHPTFDACSHLRGANQRARALSSALAFFPSVEVRERYKVGSVSNLGAKCNVHNDASTELPCASTPNPLRCYKVGSLSNLGTICSVPSGQSELHIKSLDDKHASTCRADSWPQLTPERCKVGSVSNLGAASPRINDAVLRTHSSTAPMRANAQLPCDTTQDLSQRYKVGSLSNLGAYSPPIAAPASPAFSVPTARSMPKASAITDLHMIIAAQVQIGPEWLAGPFLNTDARSLTRMQLEPAAADRDTRYTILEYRSDTIVRRSMPAWTPLEYVAHAIRQVPYRVQRAYFLEVPLPGYPCPQILLTPAGLPLGHRTLPIDLRPLQGLLHVVRVPCGLETPALWDTLQDKGVEDLDALATATRDGRLTLTDQNGRIVPQIRPLPEQQWLIAPGIEEDLPPNIVLRYVGGGPLTFRLPRPPQPIEPPRHATAAEIEALRAAEHPGPAWPDTTSTTTAMRAEQKTVERPASTPPGIPEPDIEPPSLLQRVAAQADEKLGQTSRPQEVPSILPGYLERDCLQQESVDVYSWGATAGAPNHAYTIFDVVRHATTRPRPREGTLTAIIRAAVLEAPFPVGAVQVLMKGVQGLPQPQLVLHQRNLPNGQAPIPWDLRPVGGDLYTVNHKPQESLQDAVDRLPPVLPAATAPSVCDSLVARHYAVLDAAGIIGHTIPQVLSEVQHFLVEPAFSGFASIGLPPPWDASPSPFFWPTDGAPSTTSTTSTSPNEPPSSFRFTMLCGPHSYSAVVQPPCYQADAILERLIREVLALSYPAHGPLRVMLAAGQPAVVDNQQEVIFLLCNSVYDRTATVVVDERAGGHSLHTYHVAPHTMCESLIAPETSGRGISVVVNGAPARLTPKWPVQGDYIQFDEGQGPPAFTPTSWILRQLEVLLPYTWPLHVGDGVYSLDVPACARLRRRAQGTFHPPEGGCLVLGIHHGPVAFNLGQPVVPSVPEMQAGLAQLDDCPPAMLETYHTRAVSISERTVFVSAPTQYMYRTVLAPCLPFPNHYIAYAVLPGAIELNLILPQGVAYRRPRRRHQHGDILEIFLLARCVWPYIRFVEYGLPLPQAAHAPQPQRPPYNDGTALVQIPDYTSRHMQRCARLQQLHPEVDCPCIEGAFRCSEEADAEPSATGFPFQVPTPFGRRRISLKPQDKLEFSPGTLWAHNLCEPGPGAEAPSKPDPTILTLDRLIAPRAERREAGGLLTGVSADMFPFLFEQYGLALFSPEWQQIPDVPSTTRQFLDGLRTLPSSAKPAAIQFFVDGSFFPAEHGPIKCGWAICALAYHQQEWQWVGWLAAGTDPDGDHSSLCEPVKSSYETELSALCFALTCAVSMQVPCLFGFDSTSAAATAAADAVDKNGSALASACASLVHLLELQGCAPLWHHIRSHQGHPLNEFVDATAKFAAKTMTSCHLPTALSEAQHDGTLPWIWLATGLHPSVPRIDQSGILRDAAQLQGDAHTLHSVLPSPAATKGQVSFDFQAVTYNCLTLKSQAQQESLAEQFNKHHCSVIGLQETRTTLKERKANRHFHVIGGPAENGQLGCQLWLTRSRPVAFCGKTPITWDPTTFCVLLATPRLLLVTAKAADQTFAFLVGHSPTAKAGQAACALFWQHMNSALRRIPTNSIPLVLVDANAKNFGARGDLDEIAEPHHNHEGFANLVASHALTTSGHVAHDGQEFVSWTGPDGQTACIDYVLCPTQLAQGMCILGPLPGFVGYLDHDHKPIATQIRWQTSGSVRHPNVRLKGDGLHTAAGRQALRQAYRNMPPVPWEVSVDEHLRRINQHVIDNLQQVCVRSGNKPRDRTTSDHTWALIRDRRHLRREVHRTRGTSLAPEYHTMLGEQIKDLGRLIRAAAKNDAAVAIRKAFDSARESGIDTLHRLCRSITKSGRRYRAPSLCPALRARSGQVEEDSYKVLGDHFAEAELGQHCAPTEIATREPLYEPQDFLLPSAFSVASLSRAFASLTAKRASGGSQIPVEAYKFAPLAAAHCHAPLLLKCLLRRQCPILWRGGIATAIPKPLKPADSVEGWRSILLLEAGAKGIAKAIRNDLLQGYSQLRQAGQSGSMPGQPLQISMAHVRGLVKRIKASGQSGGILFVDGRAAFYSVLREALLGTDSAQPQQFVEKLAELVFHTREKQSDFILAALGPGLLQQTGVPLAVRRYVAAGLDRTWFSVGQSPRHVYETRCGSVPGAPLADLYFQIIFSQVLANIYAGLEENGLIANCPGTSASSQLSLPIPTWMDDIAVPVLAPKPCQLLDRAAQAVRVVDTAMHAAGIRLNFSRGKTEFLAVIGGEGSRQLRQEWLCANGATFTVPLETAPITVHLTGSYIHLGSEIAFSGKDGPDIFRRRSLARRLTTDLSKLMHNSCLSTEERLNMLIAMPLARFRHGAGLWSLEFTQDQHAYQSAYIEPFRKYFRALTGITSQGLDDHQICQCLGILTAAQMREVDLTRHVGWLAADGSSVLRELWLTSGPWFQEAQRAVKACSAHLGIRPTTAWEALLAKPCLAKQWARSYARRCRKIQRQLQPAALRRWQTYHDAQQQGAFFLHVRERARTVGLTCPECHCHFDNPAALGSHRSKVHGVAARATQVTFGTRCEVCSTEYWSTRRLREHLRRSPTCLKVWEAADREVEAPANEAGHEWLPSAKACGPRPWWATLQPEDPPEPGPQAALPSAAIFAKWLEGESSKIPASQLLDLVEKGIRFRLNDDDLPLASLHMSAATYSLVQHAMWAAQTILAQSAGSQEDSFWRVSVQGMRVIFWPNGVRTAATNWSELPTEWAFD